jgi:Flp pilus assembly protein TadG
MEDHAMSRFEAFRKDTKGNVAIIFSLALLPLVGVSGMATDYARVRHVENQYQSALDATVLMLTRYAPKNDATALQKLAEPYFNAVAAQHGLAPTSALKVVRSEVRVGLSTTGRVDPVFGPLFGVKVWDFTAKAEASFATRNIEVALVLDNTGSMAASNKIGELKKASHSLLKILEDVAVKPGQVKVSLVPYTTRVNIGTGFRMEPWLTNHPTGTGFKASENYHLPASRWTWGGCVGDRDAPYNRDASPANTGVGSSLYPMINCEGALAQAMPLNSDFKALHARVDTMVADGWTNITLGAQWGLETLTANAPFNETGTAPNTERFMILLTDGMNTKDRWAGVKGAAGSAAIEARMNTDTQGMCDAIAERGVPEAAKTLKIKLYTVLVIDGNETLLKSCASTPDMFRKVNNASELEGVFKQIANEIGKVSLTM